MNLPRVPTTCPICNADYSGGCSFPGFPFKDKGLRVFYKCGCSVSVVDRAKEMFGHEDYVDNGYCFFLRVKNCGSNEPQGEKNAEVS